VEDHIVAVAADARLGDPKNRLQELAARLGSGIPTYSVTERGPDHAKQFSALAVLNGRSLGQGEGKSKKDAERRAAEAALSAIASSELEDGRGDLFAGEDDQADAGAS
ncbi:MAG: putative dsRNA-binding protein, partial [Acidimicrobiales bacterium]